jgi:hypothetical protein
MYEIRPEVKKALEKLNSDTPEECLYKSSAERKLYFIFGFLFLIILILTYSLPDNVLDIAPTLKSFVSVLSELSPSVANFGKYSDFPQIAQLVYSLIIVSIPVLTIPMCRIHRANNKMITAWQRSPFYSLIVSSMAPIFFLYATLFYLPGEPYQSVLWKLRFLSSVYHLKLSFSVHSTISLIVDCFSITIFLVFISNVRKIFPWKLADR